MGGLLDAFSAKIPLVDALERDDLEVALRMTPEERARDLMEVIRTGFRLKEAALRARFPNESDAEIDARFQRWLDREDE
ncbi:MAG TPA: hypothetical protein VHV30_15445 [Polyangiaceae bacterium]|jgi:hypothetical protein|nr:hypothetical protein [Polyangiaceae bacterium]